MSGLLDFFAAGPARVKALLVAAMAMALVCMALTTWALVERLGAVQARAERDRALDQVAVVSAAAKACSAGVARGHAIGEAATAAIDRLLVVADRLSKPAVHTIERTEKILERPSPPGAGCDQAWDRIEDIHRTAGAP